MRGKGGMGGGGGAENDVRVGVDMLVCVTDLLIMINVSSVLLKLGWGGGGGCLESQMSKNRCCSHQRAIIN